MKNAFVLGGVLMMLGIVILIVGVVKVSLLASFGGMLMIVSGAAFIYAKLAVDYDQKKKTR